MAVKLQVVYRDPALLVIEKPGGLLAVPGRGPTKQDCLVSRSRTIFPDLPQQPAVHRLDMQTSGLMILARTSAAHKNLCRQFQHHQVVKRYLAIVEGDPDGKSGTIELSFRLDPENRPLQIYDPVNGKPAVTLWRRLNRETLGTRIEFTPLTGRTHQLRVHAAHPRGLGTPVIGDSLYGSGKFGDNLMLHAAYLSFNHPDTGSILEFFSTPAF